MFKTPLLLIFSVLTAGSILLGTASPALAAPTGLDSLVQIVR